MSTLALLRFTPIPTLTRPPHPPQTTPSRSHRLHVLQPFDARPLCRPPRRRRGLHPPLPQRPPLRPLPLLPLPRPLRPGLPLLPPPLRPPLRPLRRLRRLLRALPRRRPQPQPPPLRPVQLHAGRRARRPPRPPLPPPEGLRRAHPGGRLQGARARLRRHIRLRGWLFRLRGGQLRSREDAVPADCRHRGG
ncbi:putative protein TIC 20-v, chloroplastic [Iris pallida]|uniref:Uncharacterized protein n=1 Tax=Iris pallida TaxID=29817 RepID=A0AAX6H6G2_IRIPA|nr:putative protein TIC 20-v, chloroplastic [Iris pallida]